MSVTFNVQKHQGASFESGHYLRLPGDVQLS